MGRRQSQGIFKKKAGLYSLEHYYAIMLNEGCRLLKEDIVSSYKIIDNAMLTGMDMPGPFSAGRNKYEKWSGLLEKLSDISGIDYLHPCELMKTGKFIKMK